MKYLILILLFPLLAITQDFDLMRNHLDNEDCLKPIEGLAFLRLDSTVTEGYYQKVLKEDQLEAIEQEYKAIYREEYLRLIAKKFLEQEFSKPKQFHVPLDWWDRDSLAPDTIPDTIWTTPFTEY